MSSKRILSFSNQFKSFLVSNKSYSQILNLKTNLRIKTNLNTKPIKHLSYPNKNLFRFASTQDEQSSSEENASSSVDAEEMKRFKLLANSWWLENGEYEALHRMNNLRVPLIRDTLISYRTSSFEIRNSEEKYSNEELLRSPLLGLNILDIGCGGGLLSEPLARLGANVIGIDSCKENIISAQLRVDSEIEKMNGNADFYDRLKYINCSLEDLAAVEENNGYFDAVVMSEVVEHVNNLNEFLINSTKLLKNKGFSFITTLNRTPQSYLLAIVGAENILGIVPKGTHTWEKFVKPEEIIEILEKNHVFVKFQMGMKYNPFTKQWSWFDNKSVNYALYAQKFTN